ncbi:MAG TPA: hypothetical protein VK806_05065 [Bacteroidia bacterium]|jgi:hypothetical protein|nr:hypothetical protein [Bacteroidia bacterium]
MKNLLILLLLCITTLMHAQLDGLTGKWKLEKIETTEKTMVPEGEKEYYLTISGTYTTYNLDINKCWGTIASLTDSIITLTNNDCTKVCCDGSENPFSLYINYTGKYSLQHDSILIITTKNGDLYLRKQ